MGVDSHMIHTCTLQRATIQKDDHGADVLVWTGMEPAVRCRLVIATQRSEISDFAERPIITTYKLLLPAYTDVQQGDRIVDVRDERGVVDAGPYRIESVLPRRGKAQKHISVLLERVK